MQLAALLSVSWHAVLAVTPVAPASEEVEVSSGGVLLRREQLQRTEQAHAALHKYALKDNMKVNNKMQRGSTAAVCIQGNIAYNPLDMPNEAGLEASLESCRDRCRSVQNCAHFIMSDTGMCHLQDNEAAPVGIEGYMSFSITPSCSDEVQKLINFHESSGQESSIQGTSLGSCSDSLEAFTPSDLDTSDLQQNDDDWLAPDKLIKCSDLYSLNPVKAVCQVSAQVTQACPQLCGQCGIQADTGGCSDKGKDDAPIFSAGNTTMGCNVLADACSHDDEVAEKCRETCGWCNFTSTTPVSTTDTTTTTTITTTTTETPFPTDDTIQEILGCTRRRSMGYCFTRRRRLF